MPRMTKNPPAKRFTAWSISRYLDHSGPDGCPRRSKLRHLDKIDAGPPGPALVRGRQVHVDGDAYLSKQTAKVPEAYTSFATEMRQLRPKLLAHEASWAFTKDWEPTGWFDANVWCRVRCDAVAKKLRTGALVIDFKTGQMRDYRREEYRMQLELYAVAAFAQLAGVKVVTCELWYVDHGVIYGGAEDGYVYQRSAFSTLVKTWADRVKKMMHDRVFSPRPGAYCRYCPYSKSKQCQY